MGEYIVGVYKEVAKKPDVIKIKNQKEYLEKLLDGEYATYRYDDYVVLYKKDNDRLLGNIYINTFSQVGLTIKGKIFITGIDENGNLISLNKSQFLKCTEMISRQEINYRNFDEKGRLLPKYKRNRQNRYDKQQEKSEVKEKKNNANVELVAKPVNIGGEKIAESIRLEKVDNDKIEKNHSNLNENENGEAKKENTTNDSTPPVIRLSDEETLQVLNKMIYIIHEYIQKLLEMMSNDQ